MDVETWMTTILRQEHPSTKMKKKTIIRQMIRNEGLKMRSEKLDRAAAGEGRLEVGVLVHEHLVVDRNKVGHEEGAVLKFRLLLKSAQS